MYSEVNMTQPPADWHMLKVGIGVVNSDSTASITADIDTAMTNKALYILAFHEISAGAGDFQYAIADFKTVIDHINTQGYVVKTLTEYIDSFTEEKLDTFAATTSAELASVISDETGTGLLVFGTSPTFITPALGTPASGVATNLTGTSGITGLGALSQALDFSAEDAAGMGRMTTTRTTLTLDTNGSVTSTTSYHTIETFEAASTDDLDNILTPVDTAILFIRSGSASRDPTAKDTAGGTGDLRIVGDFTFTSNVDFMMLSAFGTLFWIEVSRADTTA